MTTELHNVVVRNLTTLDEYLAAVALQEATWGDEFSELVPAAILRVGQLIGGVTAGAFDDAGRLVGFVFGLTGVRDGQLVHWSDMLAVREGLRGHGIGERLKRYQREMVLALGARTMLWTFDPLVARNAHFNINRLGALPIEYHPDMYGSSTGSALHGALPTDRFIVAWDLERVDDAPATTMSPTAEGSVVLANTITPDGSPIAALLPTAPTAVSYRVQIPPDFAQVQRAGVDRALRWRHVVRDVVTRLMVHGYRIKSFVRGTEGQAPYYVFTRGEPGAGR